MRACESLNIMKILRNQKNSIMKQMMRKRKKGDKEGIEGKREGSRERRKESEKGKKKRGLERRKEEREHFFLMGNNICLFSATQFGEDLFIHSLKSY